ncbi:LPS-assembly protein LptD [Methylosarcina fibrata]|uniref:LPS-assembly protein LptD n=1 Tax=Methylosarcina fibrata TaxID=105972 RepID=UPI0003800C85|nr:LPS-assembly protein LptD [Methylosarcina fibrata]
MHRPLFLLFLLLFARTSIANNAVWNCQQDKASKEWSCVGEKKQAEKTAEKAPSGRPEAVVVEKPALPIPEPRTPAPVPETAQSAEPGVAAAQPTVTVSEPAGSKPIIPVSRKRSPEEAKVKDTSRPQGWTCKAGGQDTDWNCNLVGPDPKGEARIVESDEHKFSLLNPAFDYKQEQIFNNLSAQLKYDPWANCTIEMSARPAYVPGRHLRDVSPLEVTSDYSEVFENEISRYTGNVEITRADQRSLSNAATYDTVSETLDLQGDVYYSEDELALYSNTATLELASDQAKLRNVMFISPSTPLRGRAKTVYRDNKFLSRYKEVAYTSCPPNNQDWVVHATDLKLNDETGKGAAKNAWLEFKGLPVFYSPYLSFPMDERRLSGFLAPSFGNTQQSGFNFSIPYYWNIAPNYDATLNPRYYTDRGLMLGGIFRLLTKYSNSIANLEYMPNDNLRNTSRFYGSFKNTSHFTPNISSNMDLNYVSDNQFFAQLGSALSFPNFSYVRSSADLGYNDQNISLVGRMVNYQTIDESLTGYRRPYTRLPEIDLNLNHAFEFMPLNTALDGNFVNFQHDSIVNAQRFNIKPSVSFPIKSEAAYLTPKISVQHTDYQLSNDNNGVYQLNDPTQVSPFPNSVTRTLPIVSLDSGLFFEKEFQSASIKHTLEPRLFYLYIPRKDQNDIPLFDTSRYDFWYQTMFRENRFSGSDRLQDANQVTAALTSRLIDSATGKERLKLSLGEIFYFQDREVTAPLLINYLPGWLNLQSTNGYLQTPAETNSLSPLVAEISSEFADHWSAETGIQWDPSTNSIVRGKAVLHFINEPEQIFNIGFLYRQNQLIQDTIEHNLGFLSSPTVNPSHVNPTTLLTDKRVLESNDIIQSDVSFRWPIINNWFAVGRWQYSWLYNQTQETFLGLEKENCCWRFRVIGRRYVNNVNVTNFSAANSPNASSQTGIFFQVELKGLTGIGEKLDKFFEQSIYGYQKPEK